MRSDPKPRSPGASALIAAVVAATLAAGGVPSRADDEPAGDADAGGALYQRYCVSCHGSRGDGNGDEAAFMTPKPRDYRQGIFKCRSTPTGSLPLRSDLERTMANGIYGTHMPPWFPIGHRARLDLIAYIQTFSPRWKTESPLAPIVIPDEPADSAVSVSRGREIYEQSGCANCHGAEALGDGPSAKAGLQDAWGNPIAPANLTTGHMKCGSAGTDIYRELMTGLDGTPMASFTGALGEAQAWDLVHYIQSLGGKAPSDEGPRREPRTAAIVAAPIPPPAKAVVSDEQILALEPIHFRRGRAEVEPRSFAVLDEIAGIMKARPSLRVRVEGHTDSTGRQRSNEALSRSRAQAVVDYLVGKGVEAARLVAVGYGSSRPMDGGDSPLARSRNRRTEFHIVTTS